jgi:branched-subunit amino acid permease
MDASLLHRCLATNDIISVILKSSTIPWDVLRWSVANAKFGIWPTVLLLLGPTGSLRQTALTAYTICIDCIHVVSKRMNNSGFVVLSGNTFELSSLSPRIINGLGSILMLLLEAVLPVVSIQDVTHAGYHNSGVPLQRKACNKSWILNLSACNNAD